MKVPYAKPGTSMANKTGAWRQTKKPEIEKSCCIKCGQCVKHCPEGCIGMTEKGAAVDYDYCKGCGICSTVCPKNCIKMVAEEKKV